MHGMAMMSFRLQGERELSVNMPTRTHVLDALAARLDAGQGFTLATLNLDHLVKLRHSETFRQAYLATDFVVADGNPIVWLSRFARRPVGLVPGSELVKPICCLAARLGTPVALYGSDEATLAAAAARLQAAHPGLNIIWRKSPPRGFDPASPAAMADAVAIGASGARLCFVALGAPRQEIFAVNARHAAPACGFVSVGAGLDFVAGTQKRAPVLVRRLALEWAWRLICNPRRLAGRYAACTLILPSLVLDALQHRDDDNTPAIG